MARVPLTRLVLIANQRFGAGSLKYQRVYHLILSGVVPAAFEDGRWTVAADDVDGILERLCSPAQQPQADHPATSDSLVAA